MTQTSTVCIVVSHLKPWVSVWNSTVFKSEQERNNSDAPAQVACKSFNQFKDIAKHSRIFSKAIYLNSESWSVMDESKRMTVHASPSLGKADWIIERFVSKFYFDCYRKQDGFWYGYPSQSRAWRVVSVCVKQPFPIPFMDHEIHPGLQTF